MQQLEKLRLAAIKSVQILRATSTGSTGSTGTAMLTNVDTSTGSTNNTSLNQAIQAARNTIAHINTKLIACINKYSENFPKCTLINPSSVTEMDENNISQNIPLEVEITTNTTLYTPPLQITQLDITNLESLLDNLDCTKEEDQETIGFIYNPGSGRTPNYYDFVKRASIITTIFNIYMKPIISESYIYTYKECDDSPIINFYSSKLKQSKNKDKLAIIEEIMLRNIVRCESDPYNPCKKQKREGGSPNTKVTILGRKRNIVIQKGRQYVKVQGELMLLSKAEKLAKQKASSSKQPTSKQPTSKQPSKQPTSKQASTSKQSTTKHQPSNTKQSTSKQSTSKQSTTKHSTSKQSTSKQTSLKQKK